MIRPTPQPYVAGAKIYIMGEVQQNGVMPGPDGAINVNTRVLVTDYIRYHLQKHDLHWTMAVHAATNPGTVELTMRTLGDEFENRYREVFEEMSQQLHITPNTAQQTFLGVVNELFSDGINWGRIVALFAFGATLSEQCIENEMPAVVDQIIDWITQYTDTNLHSWIQENGGWDGFLAFYEGGPEGRIEPLWPSVKKICGYAAVGAIGVLTIGAFLSSKS